MEFWKNLLVSLLVLFLGLSLSGCLPAGQGGADDEKEPHYVLGQSRVNSRDFSGAIEAFEDSLEVNPHSAAAHFQLAMLYDEKEPDPAAAIYHYQQYLRFDPQAANAEVITQRINTCKQQLAKDVLLLPSSPAAQQQLQQLADTNRLLQAQIDYYARQLAMMKTNLAATTSTYVSQSEPVPAPAPLHEPRSKPAPSRPRTHTVVAGETVAAIARKTGVSLSALLAANPGLKPTRMQVGQVINLPGP